MGRERKKEQRDLPSEDGGADVACLVGVFVVVPWAE